MSTKNIINQVTLLSYDRVVGWRVACVSKSKHTGIGVVKIGSIKLLRIPQVNKTIPGRFCNPRKLLEV